MSANLKLGFAKGGPRSKKSNTHTQRGGGGGGGRRNRKKKDSAPIRRAPSLGKRGTPSGSTPPYQKNPGYTITTTTTTQQQCRTVPHRRRVPGSEQVDPLDERGQTDTLLPMHTINNDTRDLSPRFKGKPPRRRWWIISKLPWINLFAWLALMIALIVVSTRSSFSSSNETMKDRNVVVVTSSSKGWNQEDGKSVLFTLIPSDPKGKTMKLPLHNSGMNYDKLLHYDVCCYRDEFFVCRSVTRNVAVDCILERDKTNTRVYALIMVKHPDMNGARCRLSWLEAPPKEKTVPSKPQMLNPQDKDKGLDHTGDDADEEDEIDVPQVKDQV